MRYCLEIFRMLHDSLRRDNKLLSCVAGYKKNKNERRKPRFDLQDTQHPVIFHKGDCCSWNDAIAIDQTVQIKPRNHLTIKKHYIDGASATTAWLYFRVDIPIFLHDVSIVSSSVNHFAFEVAIPENTIDSE